jgi:hypothetical protein
MKCYEKNWFRLGCFGLLLAGNFGGMTVFGQKPTETYTPKPSGGAIRRPPAPSPGELIVATNLAGATIELFSGPKGRERLRATAVSDDKQQALFSGLPAGRYRISIRHADYEPFVTDCVIRAGRGLPVVARLIPRFGFLTFSADQLGATAVITVDEKPLPAEALFRNGKTVALKVATGRHRVTIRQRGYRAFDEQTEITPDARIPMTLIETPPMLDLTAPAGARVYVNGIDGGTVPTTGRLSIPVARAETYRVAVEADGFETFRRELPATAFDAEDRAALVVELRRIAFSKAFSDSFLEGLTYWDAPPGWRVAKGRLDVAGSGIGFVRDRVYRNFTLEIDAVLTNGRGACWVLRARDQKRYYLFQLSGPAGKSPNTFRCFKVENGVATLLKSDRIVQRLDLPNDQLHLVVDAAKGRITHSLSLLSAPAVQPIPLSVLEDEGLEYGGIGFTTLDDEAFGVFQIVVIPQKDAE